MDPLPKPKVPRDDRYWSGPVDCVWPQALTTPTTTDAQEIGFVPTIFQSMPDESGPLHLESDASSIVELFTTSLSTPFNIIASDIVLLPSTGPLPSGHITITLTGTISGTI